MTRTSQAIAIGRLRWAQLIGSIRPTSPMHLIHMGCDFSTSHLFTTKPHIARLHR
jgi:hypothetical protein